MTFIPIAESAIGAELQTIFAPTSASATTTTTLPVDNTTPQSTEGGEFMSQAITVNSVDNPVYISVHFMGAPSVAAHISVALFRDSGTDALAVMSQYQTTADKLTTVSFIYQDNLTEETGPTFTYKVRAGMDAAGTLTINGISGDLFNAKAVSSIFLREVQA